jgi:hypothetical protein
VPDALIGSTGFIGGTLLRQRSFDDLFNSKNVESIRGRSYDLLVCSGAPAAKWVANQNADADLANLQRLMNCLADVRADRLMLISTVDVYRDPRGVDEATVIDPKLVDPYGRHRFLLEEFVRQRFASHSVVRLPGLFGKGLKKNFIYDLIHNNALDWTHCESVFQFYDLSRLWSDLKIVLDSRLPLIDFATEPVRVRDLAKKSFGVDFTNVPNKPPVNYDMRSRHTSIFGATGPYMYSANETFQRVAQFVREEKAAT